MKKSMIAAIAGLVFMGMTAGLALAQEDAPASRPRRQGGKFDPGARPDPGAVLDRIIKDLGLTGETEARVRQIFETHRQAMDNWRKEHGQELDNARTKLREAEQKGDQDATRQAREQVETLMKSRAALRGDLLKQLGEVLTPEQVEKVKAALDAMAGPGLGGFFQRMLEDLNLTADQKAKVEAIMKEARESAAKLDDPVAKAKLIKDATDKIKAEVLTDEQRKLLEQKLQGATSRPGFGQKFRDRARDDKGGGKGGPPPPRGEGGGEPVNPE